jgi:hypothetical protein
MCLLTELAATPDSVRNELNVGTRSVPLVGGSLLVKLGVVPTRSPLH